jgi:nucleotide-binding universal stress UspA family protein
MAGTTYGVLLGYDGSAGSDRALSWAAREAKSRGTALTVCLAWTEWYDARPGSAQPPGDGVADHARRAAERVAAQGLRMAQNLLDAQDVRLLVVYGSPAAVLCDHSLAADMVVVGSRGRGGMSGLLLGSVGLQVAAHASGRAVVVRGHWRRNGYVPGPVVLGADGSACSRAAAAFAFEEAELRHAPLLAVCALADTPGSLGGAGRLQEGFENLISQFGKEHPEVTVLRQVSPGSPRPALLAAAHRAQMLVVGARGLGGIRGMMLGSVSHAVVHHAPCPVAVVHLP